MEPKATPSSAQPDFFQVEPSSIISSRHPLVRLSKEIPWGAFDQLLQPTYAPVMGAPGITTRLMVALHYLKFQCDLSDENVVAHWVENLYWQFFSDMQFFSHEAPIDPSSMGIQGTDTYGAY
jgi:transposase, IS5 family